MTRRLSTVCHLIALLLLLLILMAAFDANIILVLPGAFLFDRFHLASLYIPSLLFIGGLLLRIGRSPRRTMLLLWISPLPFITAAAALQALSGRTDILASRFLIDLLGRGPAAGLLILTFFAEILGMVKLGRRYRRPDDILITFAEIKEFLKKANAFLGLTNSAAPEEGEEATPPSAMPAPPLPEVPEMLTPQKQEAPIKPISPAFADKRLSDFIRHNLGTAQEEGKSSVTVGTENEDDGSSPLPSSSAADSLTPAEEVAPLPNAPEAAQASGEWQDKSQVWDFPEQEGLTDSDSLLRSNDTPTESVRRRTYGAKYRIPVDGILTDYPDAGFDSIDDVTRQGGEILERTLKEFRIEARVTGIRKGPVITMYEMLPSPGVKISSIVNLQDNIALRLAASRVRIVAPIPGKHAIGIEVPNRKRSIVPFSSLVSTDDFQKTDSDIPIILGKDISGEIQIIDLTRTPHLLIAGATGSGKSVCVNSLIGSILYSRQPREVKMIMVDPKIVELKLFNDIPHLLTPVITEPKRAIQALQWCLCEMERRYSLLDSQGVRDMNSYNRRVKDRKLATEPLPYIVVIVDEFADLMATSGKELEAIVARLAAMSRAVGIHLVLATQRPSVDVITGLIKANFPSRIAFMVAGKTDSRIIIDTMGAEKLLGRGDMLFTSAWDPFPTRMQGAFLAEQEVERMTDFVKTLGEPDYIDDEMFFDDEEDENYESNAADGSDPMYGKALDIVISSRKASASYLQRKLKIGYNRAARLVEEMEQRGIVGPANGSKARDILHIPDRYSTPGGKVQEREEWETPA